MKTADIREKFLNYFANNGHTIEPSSSLIPHNDKTLLFVNAGMTPFKNVFNGIEKRPYTRASSSQRCVRAGGKHNDLENVGYTARHHTFFEMLGNFSFGDYFKKESIGYAWEFLTNELKIPADKLWVSVYEEDDEAENIWVNEIGFPKSRISRCGAKDNFWQMGETGPCGPCSEIFYDHGQHIAGGPPGSAEEDGDRFIEIWNLVFTQFDRQADGHLKPLKKPCVDTGMGLERIAAVMQHKENNYDIDLFNSLTKHTAKLAGVLQDNVSVRVIADHIRSCSFLIADGVLPSNEGRGYVLRRIIRRALRHGHKLGINKVFFYRLAPILALEMGQAYPELKQQLALIETSLKKEENRFRHTLEQGMDILTDTINSLEGQTLSGELAFKLYDTYGFPLDLTQDIAKEHGLNVDNTGFKIEMDKQKVRAKEASQFAQHDNNVVVATSSEFVGYDSQENNAIVSAIITDANVRVLDKKQKAQIVLDKSVFYAESGGQVGDSGFLRNNNAEFKVIDTKKQTSGAIVLLGELLSGTISIGDTMYAEIDKNKRKNIARNHSATHLLHAALKQTLGEHVNQKGSLVDEYKLRFDFSYDGILKKEDLVKIEGKVNRKILGNTLVHTDIMGIEDAKKKGAMALFGEKYDKIVRVLSMGKNDFSVELCGGTHVKQLGDIGLFRIVSESGVAAGVRRIEAITGWQAYQYDNQQQDRLEKLAQLLKSNPSQVVPQVEQLLQNQKQLEQQIHQAQTNLAKKKAGDLLEKVKKIGDIHLLSEKIDGVKSNDLRDLIDILKNKINNAIIVLASVENQHISLIVGVSKTLTNTYHAGNILKEVATQIDGKGGGRADMAQGGGSNIDKLGVALASVEALIKGRPLH